MTFRDDHDAALARADALEDEVERTRHERDALAAKVKELEAKAKEPAKPAKKTPTEQRRKERRERQRAAKARREETEQASDPDKETKGEKVAMLSVVGIVVLVFGGFMLLGMRQSCNYKTEHAAWKEKSDARKAHRERWDRLVSVEHCLRRIAYDSMSVRRHAPDKDASHGRSVWPFGNGVVGNCTGGAAGLLGDAKTPVPVKTAIGKWLDIQKELEAPINALEDYYGHQDWKEDGFAGAPALWKPVLALLARQVAAIAVVRRDAVPVIRDEIRGYLAAHEKASGRDDIYWHGALSVALWEINDRSFEAAGIYAGREPDRAAGAAAIRPLVEKFLELAKAAPIELRREVRKLDWITSQVVTGGELIGETPLWHLMMADDEWIGRGLDRVPALPPDPGKEPEDPDY